MSTANSDRPSPAGMAGSGFFSGSTVRGMVLVIFLCMFVNVWHPHLWGPDEPREAEIARECLADGHWVTPHFNQIPFVEKPPLYYDLAAAAFRVQRGVSSGDVYHPGAARAVSALLGCVMLGSVLVFAWKLRGPGAAATACALCMSMPQFYRAAHWILVDIGVGAFVTAALSLCGVMIWTRRRTNLLSALFFLFAGAAFLTKGTVTAVYIGIVVLPWMALRRKGLPFRLNWTMLFFLVPVGVWLALFYREGGIYYLHEHFINNIFGRFFHVNLTLPGSPVTVSDVGNPSRWSFYLERLPNMFGAAVVFIPLLLCTAYRAFRLPFFAAALPSPLKKAWDFLTGPRSEAASGARDLYVYLLCWTFVPLLFFSIPAIKEVTYLLPSYAGLAVLSALYAEERIGRSMSSPRSFLLLFCLSCVLFAASAQFAAPVSLTLFWVLTGVTGAAMLYALADRLRKKSFADVFPLILAGLIGGVIIGNTPEVMVRTRLHRKCYCDFAPRLRSAAGDRRLFLRGGDESIRGCLPFFGNRPIWMIPTDEELAVFLKEPRRDRVLLFPEGRFRKLEKDEELSGLTRGWRATHFDLPEKADSFVLLAAE